MSIKYYRLAKDEEPPDEFCAVKDIGGEPSEYTFYVPESENKKLRNLMMKMANALGIDCEWVDANWCKSSCRLEFECWPEDMDIRCPAWAAMHELGVEVD